MHKILFAGLWLAICGPTLAGEATGIVTSIYVADDSSAVLFRLDAR